MIKWIKRKLFFHPHREMTCYPSEYNLEYKDIWISVGNERVHSWFIPSKFYKHSESKEKFIIFSHGNTGNISYRMFYVLLFHYLGYSSIFYDYRGYGMSDGTPSETNMKQDIRAVYDYLTKTKGVDPKNITIYGESIGTYPTVWLASRKDVECNVILHAGFSSIKNLFPYGLRWMVTEFNSEKYMKNNHNKTLIIHSEHDELIPYEHSQKMFELCPSKHKHHHSTHGFHAFPQLCRKYVNIIIKIIGKPYQPVQNMKTIYKYVEENS